MGRREINRKKKTLLRLEATLEMTALLKKEKRMSHNFSESSLSQWRSLHTRFISVAESTKYAACQRVLRVEKVNSLGLFFVKTR